MSSPWLHRSIAAALAASGLAAWPSSARAYCVVDTCVSSECTDEEIGDKKPGCVTSYYRCDPIETCPSSCEWGQTCPAPPNDKPCTHPPEAKWTCSTIRWNRTCMGYAIHEDGSMYFDLDTIRRTVGEAFAAWSDVECPGGGKPGFAVQYMGDVSCGDVEYNTRAGNVNVFTFRDSFWPRKPGQIALTTQVFSSSDGEIYNADTEMNTACYQLNPEVALDPDSGGEADGCGFAGRSSHDFLAVVTHEMGHFLGLSHTAAPQATMVPSFNGEELSFRSIEQDDINGICALFPPADVDPEACNPIPRHGFSPECGAEQVVGCSAGATPGGSGGHAGWIAALSGAAVAAAAWRRRVKTGAVARDGAGRCGVGAPEPLPGEEAAERARAEAG
ncbi:matrixin family metalloprotease [Sorangium sp. So ce1151]|uniref:matrixin family metalloprotease n=1 Tax=Sorangium sp. So ce1151 TaxID=3133332 RepID=UPI003F604168